MRRTRKAKIIATLGPASQNAQQIGALFEAGVDVFRMNFSHGSHEEHRERYEILRDLEEKLDRPIAIVMDLQGPKLRLGAFEKGSISITAGQEFRLDLSDVPGNEQRAPLPHPEIFAALEPGTRLLLDDGKVRLKVKECGKDFAVTEVIFGSKLSDRKGVNVPDVVLPLSPLTEKDRKDMMFGLDLGVDWVALSFVQKPEDVAEARKMIGGRAAIISKLEKPTAIQHLDAIIELSDAVMVARGDLGVELPPEDVPVIQKRIVRTARRMGKPVIVATQMLDSMVMSPSPTRAEASDVATAIYDGADAVMLSAETAAGDYPVESVQIMDRIICRVESDDTLQAIRDADRFEPEETSADAITAAARQVATTISAAAIVTYTTTGSTTLRAARERPDVPILGLTPRLATARRLALNWGVHPVTTADAHNFADMVRKAQTIAKKEGFANAGDRLVVTAGVPFGTPGATNILRIAYVE